MIKLKLQKISNVDLFLEDKHDNAVMIMKNVEIPVTII